MDGMRANRELIIKNLRICPIVEFIIDATSPDVSFDEPVIHPKTYQMDSVIQDRRVGIDAKDLSYWSHVNNQRGGVLFTPNSIIVLGKKGYSMLSNAQFVGIETGKCPIVDFTINVAAPRVPFKGTHREACPDPREIYNITIGCDCRVHCFDLRERSELHDLQPIIMVGNDGKIIQHGDIQSIM